MMGRLEKRYLLIQDILSWNGKRKEEELKKMNIIELEKIRNNLLFTKLSKI